MFLYSKNEKKMYNNIQNIIQGYEICEHVFYIF